MLFWIHSLLQERVTGSELDCGFSLWKACKQNGFRPLNAASCWPHGRLLDAVHHAEILELDAVSYRAEQTRETTNVPGGRGTRPPAPRHLLQINPIPPTHYSVLGGEALPPVTPFPYGRSCPFCFHSGRHWSPSGLPLPRLHRAAQNKNSNCRRAAVSDLNLNNGRTNAWNNLVKSAEIM